MHEGFQLPGSPCYPSNEEFVDGESWKGNLGAPQALDSCKGLCWAEGRPREASKDSQDSPDSQENPAHPHGF